MPLQDIYLCASDSQRQSHSDFIKELKEAYSVHGMDDIPDNSESIVLVLGGDGSLNYFINTYLKAQQKNKYSLVYFPTGTANDFAKSLNIKEVTPSIDKLHSIIQGDKKINIPIMSCNDQLFINVLSAGGPAKITNSGEDILKKLVGKLSYYISAFEELIAPESYKLSCKVNDEAFDFETYGFIAAQGLFAGGGIKVSSSFSANFGREFNFISYKNGDNTGLLKTILAVQQGDTALYGENFIDMSLEGIQVKSNKTIPVKLDGETYQSKEFLVKKEDLSVNLLLH